MHSATLLAPEVTKGMYLDPSCKTRVHRVLTRNGRTVLAYRVRGSNAPGVRVVRATETVNVFTKEG